jgi:transposase
MDEIITIGLDIAKSVFQVHGVAASGAVVLRRQLRRGDVVNFFAGLPPCLVAMEACGSGHYWARQVAALGHQVRLLPPAHVKPYVKRGKKNDAADAAAICEAVSRPHLQAVPVRSAENQAVLLLHRTRDLLVRQRTMLICALRSHLGEFGIVAAQGKGGLARLRESLYGAAGEAVPEAVPEPALAALKLIAAQIEDAGEKIAAIEKTIVARHRTCERSRRLATIPGIGPVIASAIAAAVPDAAAFNSGRQFAAWLGLVPGQNSTGGKQRLGRITKTGDRYLRRLLVIGATGLIRYRRNNVPGGLDWLTGLLARKPVRLVTVALANKMARIAWAVLGRGEVYREAAMQAA